MRHRAGADNFPPWLHSPSRCLGTPTRKFWLLPNQNDSPQRPPHNLQSSPQSNTKDGKGNEIGARDIATRVTFSTFSNGRSDPALVRTQKLKAPTPNPRSMLSARSNPPVAATHGSELRFEQNVSQTDNNQSQPLTCIIEGWKLHGSRSNNKTKRALS